ncbi:sugar-transfer associated ATP-grasp domain-containing protein [Flavimarina sp. Hel_I_48]|uniref:sugar-transfer associated ATP-grasp domain-containing protein n=1 Tax=Flavimarina sp. Hel_I_48 TaxID=1392488 RepID=UPI0004DF3964|nr:sugar-transfer associated ATP-grasp domain-containing protein [Flavimarina sp. Hel_I_48]
MKILYFFYQFKVTDFGKLQAFISYVAKVMNKSKVAVITDMLKAFWKHNISFSDYFYLEFYNRPEVERSNHASTLLMYKFQSRLNSKESIAFFRNKKAFYKKFDKFIKHNYFITDDKNVEDFKIWLIENNPNALMAKQSNGQAGSGLEKFEVTRSNKDDFLVGGKDLNTFYSYALNKKYDLIDTFIEQHPLLQEISPNALSTLRIVSIVDKSNPVKILKPLVRMSNDSFVDNFHQGGIAMAIDPETGNILAPVFFKDPRKSKTETQHPVTGKTLIGFKIPHWELVMPMIEQAALVVPEVRTVGWDVLITKDGPSLLEGNDNWDKTLYEKTHQEGLKPVITSIK